MPFGKKRGSRGSRGSKGGSIDLSSSTLNSLSLLENRLTSKTDLLDEMKKVVALDVQAPGLIVVGQKGAGKSTILEALTGVPLPRSSSTKAVIKMKIVADPTCTSEYAMISATDPLCKNDTKRIDSLEDLPKNITNLFGVGQATRPTTPAPLTSIAAEEIELEEEEAIILSFRSGTGIIEEDKVYGKTAATVSSSANRQAATSTPSTPYGLQWDVIYVRIVRPTGPTYTVVDLPGLPEKPDVAIDESTLAYLREDPAALIVTVVPAPDLFDRAHAIDLAKKVDPESKRTIGVVTKVHLVEKEMGIVEKLQMTSRREATLPLGYVAIHAGYNTDNKKVIQWEEAMAEETSFFHVNPLLNGLKTPRWGLTSLKNLVLDFQNNAITQAIPSMAFKVRCEMEALGKEAKLGRSLFDNAQEFFTKLCSETTALAFDLNELDNGSITKQDRRFNLGPRFLNAIDARENQARKALPSFVSSFYETWLMHELEEFRGIATNNDSMMHPIFRKAVREVCLPVLKEYAAAVKHDADYILREVTGLLLDERFGEYPRLAESLKRDVALIQSSKLQEVERLLARLLEAELNWVFVSEKDLRILINYVHNGLMGSPASPVDEDWPLISEEGKEVPPVGKEQKTASNTSKPTSSSPPSPSSSTASEAKKDTATTTPTEEGTTTTSKHTRSITPPSPVLPTSSTSNTTALRPQPDDPSDRSLLAMQLSLDCYVRLLLRRVFYAIPMNVRNVIMNEFRRDLVSLVAERYNDENKLRVLMSEEMWVNHKHKQRAERMAALTDVLQKLDQLS